MRDPARINRILIKLLRAWKAVPDQRFNQMIENIVDPYRQHYCHFYLEDDKFEEMLDAWLETTEQTPPCC